MEFKEGDKVMGIHSNDWGLICGKVTRVDRIKNKLHGEYLKPLCYIVENNEDNQFSGLLMIDETVEFNDWRWTQINTFYKERNKLLEQAEAKLQMIKTKLYNSEGVK